MIENGVEKNFKGSSARSALLKSEEMVAISYFAQYVL